MSDEDDIPEGALLAQVAALPYRMTAGVIEVLLITSRDSGRWLIPKGWEIKNHTGAQAAAVEAFEEAGLRGVIAKAPFGAYTYAKTLGNGNTALCRVQVYPLAVKRQAKKFKEKGQRRLQWMTAEEAAGHVAEPELARMIAAFRPTRGLKS
jgi:predicted NUDIX family NTP pyrophosphohydrolase